MNGHSLYWGHRCAIISALFSGLAIFSFMISQQSAVSQDSFRYHVGAWFYTFWNRDSRGFQLARSQQIYGRADPWAGVRDYADGRGAFGEIDKDTQGEERDRSATDFSDRQPKLGFYDLMSDEIVAAELSEGAAAGLEFFAFYWYVDPQTGRELDASRPLTKFFSASQNKMKLLLALISGGGEGDTISLSTWRNAIVPRIITYMANPSYMSVDDRPIFIDFTTRFQNSVEARAAFDFLRTSVRSRMGKDPMIISLLDANAKLEDAEYRLKNVGVDGFTCFQFPVARPAQPYSEFVSNWTQRLLRQETSEDGRQRTLSVPYIPCASLGVDARPWFGIGWGEVGTPGGPTGRPYVVGTTPQLFREHLADVKTFIDSRRVQTLNSVLLYAWNEWGEASASIEPSQKLGDAYAAAVRWTFGR